MSSNDNEYVTNECESVDITGRTERERQISKYQQEDIALIDDITDYVSSGKVYDEPGLQTLLGFIIMGSLYGLGQYIFKIYPNSVIKEKLGEF